MLELWGKEWRRKLTWTQTHAYSYKSKIYISQLTFIKKIILLILFHPDKSEVCYDLRFSLPLLIGLPTYLPTWFDILNCFQEYSRVHSFHMAPPVLFIYTDTYPLSLLMSWIGGLTGKWRTLFYIDSLCLALYVLELFEENMA
jgi:hypothetical protein